MWQYEPDESPKRKHHWSNDFAGFIEVGVNFVGKCPSSLTLQQAEELLNSGVEWSPRVWREKYPKRIYVVHGGVLYRATPTNPGRSYHGFPERPERFPAGSSALRRQILDIANRLNCENELRAWMKW